MQVFMLSEPEWLRQTLQTKATTALAWIWGKRSSYTVSESVRPDTVTEEINRRYFIIYSIKFTFFFCV